MRKQPKPITTYTSQGEETHDFNRGDRNKRTRVTDSSVFCSDA